MKWNDEQLQGKLIVNLSGGMDSAMGLYLLAYHMVDKPNEVIPYTSVDLASSTNKHHAKEILAFIKDEFPDVNWKDHVIFEYKSNREPKGNYRRPWFLDAYERKVFDKCILFDTKLPSLKVMKENDLVQDAPPRESVPEVKGYAYFPFYNMTKKDVAKYYYGLGLTDLMMMTNSCTQWEAHEPYTPPCKKCWWCREKKWAIGCYDYGCE